MTLCMVMHLKDLRRMSNLREDTLGQVLSNANMSAGRRLLVVDGGLWAWSPPGACAGWAGTAL